MFGLFGKSIVIGVNGKEAKELIKNEKDLIILDVRTPAEASGGKIPKSKNIDIYNANFKNEIDKLNRDGKYLVYCAAGGRSKSAVGLMEKMEFKNLYELKGGFGSY